MKASSIRDIVFAHAIEAGGSHEALPTPERCDAITQETLHALGTGAPDSAGKRAGRASFASFLEERARRIIAAAQLPADIRTLWLKSAGVSRWAVLGVLLIAFVVGFAGHAITDPHRVDLLSLSLIGIVLWNLLVYLLLFVSWVRGLFKRKRAVIHPLEPSTGVDATAPASSSASEPQGWLQKLHAKKWSLPRGSGLRKMALNFERNWWQISQRPRHAQWLLCLHLGAVMLAVGALASLWVTGLTKAYQVGWESTFLSPAAVQQCLNLLFAPVHHLLGLAPWSLEEIQSLQGWVASGTPQVPAGLTQFWEQPTVGERWVQRYTLLLAVMVIAPRLLLALWQAVRGWWLRNHMALPLQQPYFQKLQRDWAGRATSLQVLPYSLDITAERQEILRQHVAKAYGAGAQITVLPSLAYSASLPAMNDSDAGVQRVLLLNLAATPEAEIHGELLAQVQQRWGAQADVWLWAPDFRARSAGAPGRVQEREHLWQEFVRNAGLHASVVPPSAQ